MDVTQVIKYVPPPPPQSSEFTINSCSQDTLDACDEHFSDLDGGMWKENLVEVPSICDGSSGKIRDEHLMLSI